MARRFDSPAQTEPGFATNTRPQGPLRPSSDIDTAVPNPARLWNYLLGGKDHYEVDRAAGDRALETMPELVSVARHDRAFLARAVGYMVGERGLRQVLDIGAGLPGVDNTHEVAHRIAPDCRVVYVDHDPLVVAHARALLTGTWEGPVNHLAADVRDIEWILSALRQTFDLGRPVAVLLLGVLEYLSDAEAAAVVERLVAPLPPDTHLAISHPAPAGHGDAWDRAMDAVARLGGARPIARTPDQLAALLAGLELVEPGVVPCSRWRPPGPWDEAGVEVVQYCAVARKLGSHR